MNQEEFPAGRRPYGKALPHGIFVPGPEADALEAWTRPSTSPAGLGQLRRQRFRQRG
jgi:hypothetical protein